MTSHVGRLYALGAALVTFFVAWALIAAHPWSTAKSAADPRLGLLAQREQRLRQESRLVQEVVDRRFADYRARLSAYKAALARQQAQVAASRLAAAAPAAASSSYSPGVRVVTLPPLVVTRTS